MIGQTTPWLGTHLTETERWRDNRRISCHVQPWHTQRGNTVSVLTSHDVAGPRRPANFPAGNLNGSFLGCNTDQHFNQSTESSVFVELWPISYSDNINTVETEIFNWGNKKKLENKLETYWNDSCTTSAETDANQEDQSKTVATELTSFPLLRIHQYLNSVGISCLGVHLYSHLFLFT